MFLLLLPTNNLMYSNYICDFAWFGIEKYGTKRIVEYAFRYNAENQFSENYMTKTTVGTYFSAKNCARIGFATEDITPSFNDDNLNNHKRTILITSLLYAMDKIVKSCGHYDTYHKEAAFNSCLEQHVPLAEPNNNENNPYYNTNENELVKSLYAELVYIDSPYNPRQYCDNIS